MRDQDENRTLLVGATAVALTAGFCSGQDNQEEIYRPAQLLAKLRSNEPATRIRAFEEIRSKPEMLRKPNVQSAGIRDS